METTPFANLTVDADRPPHQAHELSTDGEAQAGAAHGAGAGGSLHKGVKDPPQVSGWNAQPGVLYVHQQAPSGVRRTLAAQPPDHLTALGELDGVAEQIGEDLA